VSIFLIWLAAILFFTGLALFLIRRKEGRGAGFRIRLTALFILFVIVPTVPFVFFSANLVTRGMNLLLLPGMQDILNDSMDTVRRQTEERGRDFLAAVPQNAWSPETLKDWDIHGAALFEAGPDTCVLAETIEAGENPVPDSVLVRFFPLSGRHTADTSASVLFMHGDVPYIAVARAGTPCSGMLYYRVEPYVFQTRDDLARAMEVQSTLSVIRNSLLEKNIIWSLAVVVIGLLVMMSFYVSRKLAGQVSRPVQTLVYGMEQVKKGDLNAQVQVHTRDEFQFLGDSFNTMVNDLRESREKLARAERIAAWRQVARAISHEIKNSLTPVSISLRRLRNHFAGQDVPKNVFESIAAVEDELHSLGAMASEFSTFARMPKPEKAAVPINDVIRTVCAVLGPMAGDIELEAQPGRVVPEILADREQIKRVFVNLVKNSIEACSPGDRVIISTGMADRQEYTVKVTVSDTGSGMSRELLNRIFDPDFTTKGKGTGLGLVITQKIVSDHGGAIEVESSPGEGTEFTVYL